ncbi:bifunctional 5,10-methylenetetrahydrofolate dehydrogenase/5,10-methenyltetrahydrofolate cyclohydrolase [Syntrophomonas palmitatica]|uniref:bifunctional 5,10-methylenetetrahydrofolate dehydrogenase/5,10-methenyltetrahydrofolate cyclohydrolase n=1 Tax=Syntrophomonas palmitatica TaxID=402877 RepID=UPI0006D21B7B|nr:bifunctional 5,10-methylenetetrahydrofolate dehydrogenase/5,10-methenyltetrahydrofolate cyclohydrolase [Syntrophomonas palmitatica]
MQIISGMEIAQEIKQSLRAANEKENICPVLAVILVGEQEDSLVYVGLKEKAADYIHGRLRLVRLDAEIEKETILQTINELNRDDGIHGIILQLPLPDKLEPWREEILTAIIPEKDVDGFNPYNRGRLFTASRGYASCAASGCLEVIRRVYPAYREKNIVLVGDSFDLIMPLAVLLIKDNAQVRVIPEYKPDLPGEADILVIEKGAPQVLTGEHLTKALLLIDAGFYWHSGTSCGNVDKDSVVNNEGYLLPVPGGLGPILIAKLMENLCIAARGGQAI